MGKFNDYTMAFLAASNARDIKRSKLEREQCLRVVRAYEREHPETVLIGGMNEG